MRKRKSFNGFEIQFEFENRRHVRRNRDVMRGQKAIFLRVKCNLTQMEYHFVDHNKRNRTVFVLCIELLRKKS